MIKRPNRMRAATSFLLALALLLSACSGVGTGDEKGSTPSAPSEPAAGKEAPVTASAADADPHFGKYPEPIEITTVRSQDDTFKFDQGESLDNNVWTRTLENELNIKVKNLWIANSEQFGQKMNVSIASGDLPQIIPVTAVQLKQLVDSDLIMDLTDIYEKHASPFLKEIVNQGGPEVLDSAKFDGKLMAMPFTGSSQDGYSMYWARTDWLEKLGLEAPKTMDEFYNVMEAFAKQDPDGNGQADTIGLSLSKGLFGVGYATLEGFFNGFRAYPRLWLDDGSGNLVYGSIQPEVKEALAKAQELYKAGLIDQEFGTKDGGKAAELAASGKAGLHFGGMANSIWPLQPSRQNDPKAQWRALPLPSIDAEPAKTPHNLAVGSYYAVLKGTEHPEALVKALNVFVEKGWGENTTPEIYSEHFNKGGVERHKYAPFQAWPSRKNLDAHLAVSAALQSGDTSDLNAEETDYYNRIKNHLDGGTDTLDWAYDRVFGIEGSFSVTNHYVEEDLVVRNGFYGAPMPTMASKKSTLDKIEEETFTRIIMGEPIELFDKFVSDWKKLGGDQMTAEVNEWAKNK
ncbi:extracellular solute-binding protein [Paenibacillus sp.]|uniref:extracellular solute-binding protein n=1 Tax=Paenibacillus sp. TaxID=58172 RepID=UPI00281127C2|nr:extracellular solute-binding protein [Paenibacillus sp.]